MATFGTFTAGQVLTAAELNTAGTWSSYTPTWTADNIAVPKTVNWARYTELGKWVQVSLKMTATGAGSGGGKLRVGLPVNAATDNFVMGQCSFVDFDISSPILYVFCAVYDSATELIFYRIDANASGINQTVGNSSPAFTIATGDIIYCQFMYEAA